MFNITQSQTVTPSLFGTVTTTSAPSFGGFGFINQDASQPGNTTLTVTTSSGFSGFGTFGSLGATNTLASSGFGSTATSQSSAVDTQSSTYLTQLATAITSPQIFNDERDMIIAKWNQLQAYWGTGRGYYSQNGFVDFKPENPFCRFKTIGYSCLPTSKNEDGLVSLRIAQSHDDVSKVQQQFLDALHKISGGQQTLSPCVEGLLPLPDNKCELILYILERPASGPSRRIPASDLLTALSQANIKTQLQNQLKITDIFLKSGLSPEQLKSYLRTPPAGIDPLLWDQSKLDNPDPNKLIPVPITGFNELSQRLKHQEQQTRLHQSRLDMIAQTFSSSQVTKTNLLSKLEEYRNKHLELSHRILKVIVKQEINRKMGYAIHADEEHLRIRLEAIHSELNHPTQFKHHLNELMSQLRMNGDARVRGEITYHMDSAIKNDIRKLLNDQQKGLQQLLSVIKTDASDINLIENSLTGVRPS